MSTGYQPAGTPTPRCAFNWSAVVPAAVPEGEAAVCWFTVVAGDAGRVVRPEEQPAVTTANATAAVRQTGKAFTCRWTPAVKIGFPS
jgi:hypothetical protein